MAESALSLRDAGKLVTAKCVLTLTARWQVSQLNFHAASLAVPRLRPAARSVTVN